jgi:hypothetical protein
MFVLQRTTDGKFVAPPGRAASYVDRLQDAQAWGTRAEAERERCVGNERIVHLWDLFMLRV